MLRNVLIVFLLAVGCAAQSHWNPATGGQRTGVSVTGHDRLLQLSPAWLRRLPNGLQAVIVQNQASLRTVLQVRVSASSLNDVQGQTGISEATANLLITDDLRRRLEDYGATVEVAAPYGSFNTAFSVSVPSVAFKQVVKLFFEAFTHPQFTAQGLAAWKKRRAAELEGEENSPTYLAESILDRALYHDGRQWAGPTTHSLESIELAAVESFYHRYYAPCHSWVGVIGPVAVKETTTRLGRAASAWLGCPPVPAVTLEDTAASERFVYVMNQPQLKQAYLRLGGLNVYRLSPDYPSSLVLNHILGGTPGGRLFQAMRQQQGRTYDVRSSLVALKYLHHFTISVTLSPEGVRESVQTVWQQLELLRAYPPSAKEVESAKSAILGEFLRTIESSDEILNLIMTQYIYGFPDGYWEGYVASLRAVTPESVQAAAIRYLNPEHMQIIAIGNGDILKTQLEHLGTFREIELQYASRR